jgi:hypothetical protein
MPTVVGATGRRGEIRGVRRASAVPGGRRRNDARLCRGDAVRDRTAPAAHGMPTDWVWRVIAKGILREVYHACPSGTTDVQGHGRRARTRVCSQRVRRLHRTDTRREDDTRAARRPPSRRRSPDPAPGHRFGAPADGLLMELSPGDGDVRGLRARQVEGLAGCGAGDAVCADSGPSEANGVCFRPGSRLRSSWISSAITRTSCRAQISPMVCSSSSDHTSGSGCAGAEDQQLVSGQIAASPPGSDAASSRRSTPRSARTSAYLRRLRVRWFVDQVPTRASVSPAFGARRRVAHGQCQVGSAYDTFDNGVR